jgi:isocitrate/isopropylmalate dehydrogenase
LQGSSAFLGLLPLAFAGARRRNIDDQEARAAGRAIREARLEAVTAGVRTADLGGHASTTEFTDEVISRVRSKLDVWATLGEG